MHRIIIPVVAILIGLVSFSSCKKTTADLSGLEKGVNYAPFEIGKYIIYDVDSTIWDDFLKAEIHHRSQMRYDIVDTFTSGGELSYVINVLSRPTTADPFVPNDVIYVTVTDSRIVWTQNNRKFIKMVFPVNKDVSWNGNAMIPFLNEGNEQYAGEQWSYSYSNIDQIFDPGNNLYEHTVTVNQINDSLNNPEEDPSAYAYKNYSQEVYAYNVGLIYKERIYWVFQPTSPDGQSGGSGYRKGYGVIMKAVENN